MPESFHKIELIYLKILSINILSNLTFLKGAKMGAVKDIEYTVQIWKEGNQFVAHAMPLDVISSGKTPEEARRALDEAVHLFFVTAADLGTLNDILQEIGYELKEGRWVGPSWVAIEKHSAALGV
jgi:predicted RNase H-like HicB family nuclease